MMRIIRGIYDWTIRLAAHRRATLALGGISFVESSVFPIPPDVLLIVMCLADRKKSFFYATVCTFGSVLGGVFAYGIGYFLYDTVGQKIVEFYHYETQFQNFQGLYNEWGGWIVLAGGFTPIPYKLITIASGVAQMDIVLFTLISILGRGGRFFLVAALIWKYGEKVRYIIEKYMGILTVAFFVMLIGGFYVVGKM